MPSSYNPIEEHAKEVALHILNGLELIDEKWRTRIERGLDRYVLSTQRLDFLEAFQKDIDKQIHAHRLKCPHKKDPRKCPMERLYAIESEYVRGRLALITTPQGAVQPPVFSPANTALMKATLEHAKLCVSEEGKNSPKVAAGLMLFDNVLGVAYRGQFNPGDHAEYTLFEKVLGGKDVSGATLFTTLEPCTSRNNHKPCADWIIQKKIGHVFIGMLDPNPRIYSIV